MWYVSSHTRQASPTHHLCCPCGEAHTIDRDSVIPTPAVIQKLLQTMEFPCDKCYQAVPVKYEEHTCADSRPPQSVDDIVATPLDTPLSRQEDKLATSLVRRKLAQGSRDGLLGEG